MIWPFNWRKFDWFVFNYFNFLILFVWFDLVWLGLVWFGLIWFGLVWFVCFDLFAGLCGRWCDRLRVTLNRRKFERKQFLPGLPFQPTRENTFNKKIFTEIIKGFRGKNRMEKECFEHWVTAQNCTSMFYLHVNGA